MPFSRAPVDLLLIRKVLLPAKDEQRADRRFVVASPRQGGDDDPSAARQVDVVGLGPARPAHGGVDLILAGEQGHVDRVTQQAVAGPGTANEVIRKIDLGQNPMNQRQYQVRQGGPEHYREPGSVPPQALLKKQRGQPDGGHATEDKQTRVQDGSRVIRLTRKPAPAPASHKRLASSPGPAGQP